MNLSEVSAPQGAFNEFRKQLKPSMGPAPGPPVTNTQASCKPNRIYHINMNDLIAKKNLSEAYVSGWRFLQRDEKNQMSAYEVRTEKDDDKQFQFNGKVIGNNAQQHFNILQNLVNKPPSFGVRGQAPDEEYEHTFLRAGAAKINAVWLRHKDPAKDLFIPIAPAFHGLEANKTYTAAEFLPILVEAAKKAVATFQQTSKDEFLGG